MNGMKLYVFAVLLMLTLYAIATAALWGAATLNLNAMKQHAAALEEAAAAVNQR